MASNMAANITAASNTTAKFVNPAEIKRGTVNLNYRFHDLVKHGPKVKNRIEYKGKHLKLSVPFTGPESHSLRPHVKKIYDQGKLGACVAHSMAEAIRLVMSHKNSKLSWYQSSQPEFEPSRLYIYWNARIQDRDPYTEDSGCTNLSACLATERFKVAPEELWDYDEELYQIQPDIAAFKRAAEFKNFHYSKVERSIDAFKSALYAGHPIMVGVVVYETFLHATNGDVPMPSEKDKIKGGHSILLIGYDDKKKRFTFVNHWSGLWGDSGFGSLPYDYILNEDISGDFFSVEKLE